MKTKSLLCKVGIHRWDYTAAVYENRQNKVLAIPEKRALRHCDRCDKTQKEDVHCLGLNPPEYYRQWRDS